MTKAPLQSGRPFLWQVGASALVLTTSCYNGVGWSPDGGDANDGTGAAASAGDDAGNDGASGDPDGGDGPSGGDPSCDVGPSGMRRLTRVEYKNTIRDLLGLATDLSDDFDPDGEIGPFASNAAVNPSEVIVDQFRVAAEVLADQADLSTLVACDVEAADDACARTFVETFGRRAFRRPLTPDDIERYLGVFEEGRTTDDPPGAIRLVLQAMLQSPHFMYLVEAGSDDDADVVRLTQHELASRLSYFLWNSMPDEDLDTEADAGRLDSVDALTEQTLRMLADPKAEDMLDNFHTQWLGTDALPRAEKRADLYPEFNDALVLGMLAETRAFVSDVILAGDARLSTLLTAPYTIADASVAALYGAEIPADTEGPARIELDPQERAGLLTQSAFLTTLANSTQSSFIRRGLYVRTELLCASIPPPPDDVDDNPPSSDEDGLPPRDQWQQHLTNPECAGCHTLIDMPGFAFENYDAIGKYRTKIGGDWPVDATGELVGTDVDGPFTNAIDMVAMLAESDVVHRCMAQQWMRFALARETTSEDACTSEAIEDDFLASGGNIRDLVVGIVQSKSFRLRRR